MAPLPVIGNCVRVTLNWSPQSGVTPRNVLHLITASEDGVEIGGVLDTVLAANVDAFQAMDDSYSLLSYSILPLDGTSATQEVPADSANIEGGGSGELIPAAAAVLSLRTNQRGPRGRGRLFLGPVAEAALTDGLIVSSYLNAMVGAWQQIADDLPGTSIAASLGVASYVHEEVLGVTAISMRTPAGTMRRRQNQLL